MLFKKNPHRLWTMGGAPLFMCTVHSASMTSYGCSRELLALFTATQLWIHSSENKILIRYHIVWLLVVIFSWRCNKRSYVRLHCFLSDKKRRKEWEDARGRINFLKTRFFFLPTLALMPLSLLEDHSYWQSLQTAETRNARCHLLGWKHADANHDARPLEEFLGVDFFPYPGLLVSLWREIDGTIFGLNLYLYPPPPVSSFSSCGYHISILFSELSIPKCVVVKNSNK